MPVSHLFPLHYFDHNATTPVAPEVVDTLTGALAHLFGNASSIHSIGQKARQEWDRARRVIASVLNVLPGEFVFTSGGTQSNNLALLGFFQGTDLRSKHIISSAIEHPSVLEPLRHLETRGLRVTYLQPDRDGILHPESVRAAITSETVLISIAHANNEVGTTQQISAISRIVSERRSHGQPIYFHSDGVQAFGKLPVDVGALGADLYSISAHKIHGPKGIGGLVVRKGAPLHAIGFGGRQERGFWPGTESVPHAVAFARAVELLTEEASHNVLALRDRFESRLLSASVNMEINGAQHARLPNTSNITFRDVPGEHLVIALDMQGMAVSTGAACSSGSTEPSHVLIAMQRSRAEARSAVRFSFGRYNTVEEVDALADVVIASVRRMQASGSRERETAYV